MIDKRITEALKEIGLPWHVERGKKHQKIFVCGRMVAVVSRKPKTGRVDTVTWTINQIRKNVNGTST